MTIKFAQLSDLVLHSADEVTTPELLELYNHLTGKSVKKFSSRAAGLKMVQRLLTPAEMTLAEAKAEEAAMAEATMEPTMTDEAESTVAADEPRRPNDCPQCGVKEEAGSVTAAGVEGTAAADRNFCHSCGAEWYPATGRLYKKPKANADRAGNVAASWQNPDVAAARAERTGMIIATCDLRAEGLPTDELVRMYKSMPQAFANIGLMMSRMIKCRKALKANGVATEGQWTFRLATATEVARWSKSGTAMTDETAAEVGEPAADGAAAAAAVEALNQISVEATA